MMTRSIFLTGSLFLCGCIFGGSTANDDTSAADAGNLADTTATDDDLGPFSDVPTAPPHDMPGPSSDMQGTDQGTVDAGAPSDTGATEAPFHIVGEHVLLADEPTAGAVAQVAPFDGGFVAGYTSRAGNTWMGWYEEGFPGFRSQTSSSGNLVSFDLAGDADNAYAATVQDRVVRVVRLVEGDEGTWADPQVAEYSTGAAAVPDYNQISVALEQSTPFLGIIQGLRVRLGRLSNGDVTPDADRTEAISVRDPEIIGGLATGAGRRLLVTGIGTALYQLIDFESEGGPFSHTILNCGAAPAMPGMARIVPVSEHRVVTMAATATGAELSWVACADGVPAREPVTLPSADAQQPLDFDIAEETVPLGAPYGFAWSDDDGAHFGLLEVDTDAVSATIANATQIYEGEVESVRTAFNPSTGHYGVVVQNADEVRIIILEQNQ